MTNQEQVIADIAKEVVSRLRAQTQQPHTTTTPNYAPAIASVFASPSNSAEAHDGVFLTVDEAVRAAYEAQKKVQEMSLEERGNMISIIRRISIDRCEELGRMELEETKVGRLDHKIQKLKNMKYVLGIDAMRSDARTDKSGLVLIERAAWGVIGMSLPVTHAVPTMVANAINILAAGNTAIFAPHPSGKRVSQYALQLFNREIERECGVANVITTVLEPTIESATQMFQHPQVALLCVTGGPMVVAAASKYGKRVIAAGPGNPPVVVDETADLDLAARSIIEGGGFDNNLLCIGEKEVFVVASVATAFMDAMRRAGGFELDKPAIEKLTQAAFTFDGDGKGCARAHVRKELVGKDVSVLAAAAGVSVPANAQILYGITDENHPFVVEEQMMPFIPIVRVLNVEAAIAASVKAEHGYRHTAIMHSKDVGNVTRMARALNTTIFVSNASSLASLGFGGPGYLSHSIATPTGEGITTPLTFTRERQITIGGALRII
ncbi:MAG: aldehyde dehydrogenase EutE [Acidobacteriaceae bacterium]|nr:aldehyde dehydrogenase EutE [Acidobacteriaceae bacterium]